MRHAALTCCGSRTPEGGHSDSSLQQHSIGKARYDMRDAAGCHPPTGPSAFPGGIVPRLSSSSRRDENRRCVRSAFGCRGVSGERCVHARRGTHLFAARYELVDQGRLTLLHCFEFLSIVLGLCDIETLSCSTHPGKRTYLCLCFISPSFLPFR